MATKHGDFIWYELMSRDVSAAQRFYSGLMGWQFADSGMPEVDYHIGSMGDTPVVGIMTLTDEMLENGAHPLWAGYIAVDDVDNTAEAISKAGGNILMDARDLENVGRIAMVCDPQGVLFYIMKGIGEDSQSFAKHEPAVGHCAWNELLSEDPDAAKSFYGNLFGWQKADEMDMGERGMYEMFRQDDYMIGAIMKKPQEAPVAMWMYYFRVPNIDTATHYVSEQGGQVMHGPTEIPGGEFITQGLDPQGALFAIVGKHQA